MRSPPPPAEPPPAAGQPESDHFGCATSEGGAPPAWIAGLATLRSLLPAASLDLSSSAVARWPAHAGGTCPRCGAFDRSGSLSFPPPCDLCAAVLPPFDAARSLFAYAGDVRAAIVAAKYAGRPYPVDAVALRLRDALLERWRDLIPDEASPTVVPVPTHPWKYFRRGFNLPALVASRLSCHARLAFDPLALSRTRERVPQALLPGILRHENVAAAFRVPRGRKVPREILLLDDVYTSGATAAACARALKSAGAAFIVVVTIARAVP